MGKGKSILAIAGVVAVTVALVFGVFWYFGQTSTQSVIQETTTTTTTADFCANNPDIDLEWRTINSEAASATYLSGVAYIEELDDSGNVVSLQTAVGGGSATRTDSTNVIRCNTAHRIQLRADQNGNVTSLLEPIMLTKEQARVDPVRLDIKSVNFSNVSTRVYDVVDDGFIDNNATDDNTTTDWEQQALTYWASTTADTAKTVAADDTYIVRVEAKTVIGDSQFGAKTIMCIDNAGDSDPNDWQEPTVTFQGKTLSNMKGSMTANEILALNTFESCFDLGLALHDAYEQITIDMKTGSGVNPDYDWGYRFIGYGVYEDDDNPGHLLGLGGFRTDASRTEIVTDTAQDWYFLIT